VRNAEVPAVAEADREDGPMVDVPAGPRADSARLTGEDADYRDLFFGQFAAMTRLAAMLGADDPEDVAQEAFVRLHRRTLRDPHAAIGYLRATVVNLTRSRLRHLAVVRRHATSHATVPGHVASAEQDVVTRENHHELAAALRGLTPRHREALVLRYWLDLTEAEMAEAMGVSRGTVKSHVSRGLDALAAELEARR
jgi:RNA polymerase sigma factor (sigma-70 family)